MTDSSTVQQELENLRNDLNRLADLLKTRLVSADQVGIGLQYEAPLPAALTVNGQATITGALQSGMLTIQTGTGTTEIGSKSDEYSGFYTSEGKRFYFQREITIHDGRISSYKKDEDLKLCVNEDPKVTIDKDGNVTVVKGVIVVKGAITEGGKKLSEKYQPKGDYLNKKVDRPQIITGGRLVIDTSSMPEPAGGGGHHGRDTLELRHNPKSGPCTIIVRNGSVLRIWAGKNDDIEGQIGDYATLEAKGFTTMSDMNLKHNVVQLEATLDRLEAIRGVTFQWNEPHDPTMSRENKPEVGVLAQEVEAVFPELVYAASGNDYKSIDYGRLTPILIEAVKELRREKDGQIATLKAQVAALEARLGAGG